VRIADRGVEPAYRRVPPQLVLLQEPADVAIEVAVAVHAVGVLRAQAPTAGDARRDLRGVDVERLPVHRLVVAVERSGEAVAAGLADEDRVDARHRAFGAP